MFLAEDKYVFKYITTHVKMLMHEICSYASLLSIKVRECIHSIFLIAVDNDRLPYIRWYS